MIFAWWQTRAAHPLLPPRVVLDRNRGGAYLAVLVTGAGMFGIFLLLTYYLQTILGYSPVVTGVAFLPTIAMVMLFAQISNIVLMPRIGPKVLVTVGMLLAAAGMAWLTRIGVHSNYASAIVGPMLVTGAGIGLSMPPAMNTGTFGVAPDDAGVASATLNVGQQLGGSIGTALLNTIVTSATASYLVSLHLPTAVLASPRGHLAGSGASIGGRRRSMPPVPLWTKRFRTGRSSCWPTTCITPRKHRRLQGRRHHRSHPRSAGGALRAQGRRQPARSRCGERRYRPDGALCQDH